jgi:hypothetical protein
MIVGVVAFMHGTADLNTRAIIVVPSSTYHEDVTDHLCGLVVQIPAPLQLPKERRPLNAFQCS